MRTTVALVGRKVGMLGIYSESGAQIPVTFISVKQNVLLDLKKQNRDGYSAIVVAGEDAKEKHIAKPQLGMFKKAGVTPKKIIHEFRMLPNEVVESIPSEVVDFPVGQYLKGVTVDVTSTSTGKGFQGGMKRWGFHGVEATHGQSLSHRSLGSTGCRQDPGRVFKGKKMAGRMGGKTNTVQNLQIINVFEDESLIAVKGSIPGHNGCIVTIKNAVKRQQSTTAVVNGIDLVKTKNNSETAVSENLVA